MSTDQQSHDSQLHEVRRYCERRGWGAAPEVIDTASGAKRARSGLDELMARVRKGKLDAIVVFKLDRLGRSLAHLAQLIAEFQTQFRRSEQQFRHPERQFRSCEKQFRH